MDEMEALEVSAKTVDEAIAKALTLLNRRREEVQVSILTAGRAGVFGIGHEDARILVSPIQLAPPPVEPVAVEPEDDADEAEEGPPLSHEEIATEAEAVVRGLLTRMNINARIQIRPAQGDRPLTVNIIGNDISQLIGRRGETLTSLQLITNSILGRRLRRWVRVTVDVEDYRARREESLRGLAMRVADRVRQSRQSMALEPMPPYERRIIHMTLSEQPDVTTNSIGEGDQRKVVISLKR